VTDGVTEPLRCPSCGCRFRPETLAVSGATVADPVLVCTCGLKVLVIAGVPRILPAATSGALAYSRVKIFDRHAGLASPAAVADRQASARTLHVGPRHRRNRCPGRRRRREPVQAALN
jgi:hypothetical protein